jgi:hypothetical protein
MCYPHQIYNDFGSNGTGLKKLSGWDNTIIKVTLKYTISLIWDWYN